MGGHPIFCLWYAHISVTHPQLTVSGSAPGDMVKIRITTGYAFVLTSSVKKKKQVELEEGQKVERK